jgi:hypothetical protein
MPATDPQRSPEEFARIGSEVFDRRVRPFLRPQDDGKFVAVDIVTGDYEVDADDYAAVSRLRARNPAAEIWLARAGQATAYRLGRCR